MRNKKIPFLLAGTVLLMTIVMIWWGFAFLPLPAIDPQWVEKARLVCFGITKTGLPQGYGWIMLIAAPLMILSVIGVIWGNEWNQAKGYIKNNSEAFFLCLIFLVLFFAEACLIGTKIINAVRLTQNSYNDDARNDLSVYPRLNRKPPAINLFNQEGNSVSLDSAKGKVIYLTFAFAHCQAICPTLAAELKKVHTAIGAERSAVFIISLDPWRDTVNSLADMHQQWELPSTMHVLSGSVAEVNKVLDDFNVPRSRDEKTGEVVHPALVEVIDPDGKIAYVFNGASPELLIKAGQEVLKK